MFPYFIGLRVWFCSVAPGSCVWLAKSFLYLFANKKLGQTGECHAKMSNAKNVAAKESYGRLVYVNLVMGNLIF